MKNNVTKHFSQRIRQALEAVGRIDFQDIQEIRLRNQRPVSITKLCKNVLLTENGGFTNNQSCALFCTQDDIEFTLKSVCDHSVYSYQRELSQCFVTVCGGHRVGISGTAVYDKSKTNNIPKDISSLNFRIATQKIGCGDEIFKTVMNKQIKSILIVGKPMSAKTTILRDLARLYGNFCKVSLIDERSEIAGSFNGVPGCDIGLNTDVFDRFAKPDGIIYAQRAMSPQVIICDEIGSVDDALALLDAHKSGINVIATAHAGTIRQALLRKSIKMLFENSVFDYVVLLGNDDNIGKVIDVLKCGDVNDEIGWNCYGNDVERNVRCNGGKAYF